MFQRHIIDLNAVNWQSPRRNFDPSVTMVWMSESQAHCSSLLKSVCGRCGRLSFCEHFSRQMFPLIDIFAFIDSPLVVQMNIYAWYNDRIGFILMIL